MKREVIVVVPHLRTLGGGEFVTLMMLKCLKDWGLHVKLAALEIPSWHTLREFFGFASEVACVRLHYKKWLPRHVRDLVVRSQLKSHYKDALIINAIANEIPVPAHISYIHALHFARPLLINPDRLRVFGGYVKIVPRPLYLALSLRSSKDILAVSKFTAELLRRLTGLKANVMYPPVKMLPYKPTNKQGVVTISRFSREKRLNEVLLIAQKVPNAKFIIIGSVSDQFYYKELLKAIKEFSLNNVYLLANPPRHVYEEVVGVSSILLHTTRFDSFPISVVEAMSTGTIPVVHKSGGPWKDILSERQGIYGYAYESIDEAANYINELISNSGLRHELSEKAYKRARLFSESVFKEKFWEIVDKHLKKDGSKET